MSRPHKAEDFTDQITEDRNWRIKEISDLDSAIKRGDKESREVLLRAHVVMCYAHWEGYVKFSARKYLEFVSLLDLNYRELDKQFFRNNFLQKLANFYTTKPNIDKSCNFINEILDSPDCKFSRIDGNLINTKSNLNSNVLGDICTVCGLPKNIFNQWLTFIDLLVNRRNKIAHGEQILIDMDELDKNSNKTIEIIRIFGVELEKCVANETYKTNWII
ncbi:MAG: hypothetical protein HQM01_13455 [Magnetococcales bacterium]|nr:hypothetical protein [Magnetococcales bacterium]